MSERRSWTRVDGFTTTVSMAVALRDTVTGQLLRDGLRVTMDGHEPDATTPSGYHVFLDREEDAVTVAVDGGDRYLAEERTINLSTHDPADEVTFELHPAPAYRFPSGTALIRGRVTDNADDPVASATVSVTGLSRTAQTDARGAFVYFFTPGSDGQVVERGDRKVIEIGGGDPTVEATHPDHGETSTSTEVEEGSTAVVDLKYP